MVSTRRRCRLFRPWIVKPCSRVLRKFSGELTTIQYWAERPPSPDLRFRRDRDRTGRSASDFCAWTCCSDTPEGYWPFAPGGAGPRSCGSGRRALRLRIWTTCAISWRATMRQTSSSVASPPRGSVMARSHSALPQPWRRSTVRRRTRLKSSSASCRGRLSSASWPGSMAFRTSAVVCPSRWARRRSESTRGAASTRWAIRPPRVGNAGPWRYFSWFSSSQWTRSLVRSGTELRRRTTSAVDKSSWSSIGSSLSLCWSHTRCGGTLPGRVRQLRRGAGGERGVLREVRRAHAPGAPVGEACDSRRARLLPGHRAAGRRVRVGLRRPEVVFREANPRLVATIRASAPPQPALVATIHASAPPPPSLVATIDAAAPPQPPLVATIDGSAPLLNGEGACLYRR